MELYTEPCIPDAGDGHYLTTVSYGKLTCDAADTRLQEGGKTYDIRLKLKRVSSENIGYGLPAYWIDVWYRKNNEPEIFSARFSYDRWSNGGSPIHEMIRSWDGGMSEVPPMPISFD